MTLSNTTHTRALQNKTALVIGASRGIGEAIVRGLFMNGANLVLASRDIVALKRLAAELDPAGQRVRVSRADVTDTGSIAAAVASAVSEFGTLDVAVNNAGIQNARASFVDTPEEDFDRLLNVNLRGVFVAMKHELRAMLSGGGGSIVNIASVAGLVGLPLIAPYVASKHGVIGLTRAAAAEYANRGIRVNALAPGTVMTAMLKAGPLATPASSAAILSKIPMARVASVEEIAGAVLWLASDAASYVTGVAIPIDGGYCAI